MSAYAAISTFGGLYFATIAGVAASSRILISIYSGEEDRAGLIAIMKAALHQGMGLAVVVNAIFIALAVPITNIFYHDPTTEVYRLAVWGFRLFPISMVLACFNLISCNCFQCTNKVRMANALTMQDFVLRKWPEILSNMDFTTGKSTAWTFAWYIREKGSYSCALGMTVSPSTLRRGPNCSNRQTSRIT